MDKKTLHMCWKALDRLELEAYKELERLWKRKDATESNIRDQTNMVLGITRSKQTINLLSMLYIGKPAKECNHE